MRYVVWALCCYLALLGCAKHEQENNKTQKVFKNTDETNPAIIATKAIIQGDLKLLEQALESIDINHIEPGSKSFLVLSLESKKYFVTEYLLENGADPNLKDDKGLSAIDMFTDDSLVLQILNQEPIPNEKLLEILVDQGLKKRRLAVVEWIGTKDIGINLQVGRNPPPLIYAINLRASEEEILPLVEELLRFKDVDVNIEFRRRTPVALAKRKKLQSVVNLLLANGA